MGNKRILLIGYALMNLGDDLFLSMVINRYPNVGIDLCVPKGFHYPFLKAKNVNIIFKDVMELKLDTYLAVVYVAGSVFTEDAKDYEFKKWLDENIIILKKKKIPFLFISSNYGPEYTKKWFKLCDSIIKNSFQVNFRDKISCEKFNYPNIKYFPDLVLSLKYKKKKKIKDTVGISVIDLYSIFRGKTNKYYFNYLNFLKKNIIEYIETGKKIYLFSFCKHEKDEFAIKNLLDIIDKKYYKRIRVIAYNGNISKFLNSYSRMEYVLCTRFHSMILSHVFEQKVFVCSYSKKLINVIESYKFNYDYLSMDTDLSDKIINLSKYKLCKRNLAHEASKNFNVLDNILGNYTKINKDLSIGNFYSFKQNYKKTIKKICIKVLSILNIKNVNLSHKYKINSSNDNNTKLLNLCMNRELISPGSYKKSLKVLGYQSEIDFTEYKKEGELVSFIINTFKNDDCLCECIDSILFQDYKNIEIIIIDTYSKSKLQMKLFDKYKDINIIYKKCESCDSRQIGYQLSKGKYIVFCNDNVEFIEDGFVSKSIDVMENDYSINFVGFNNFMYNLDNSFLQYKQLSFYGKCKSSDYISLFPFIYFKPLISCTVFRKSVLEQTKYFEMKDDSLLFLNAMLDGYIYIFRDIIAFDKFYLAQNKEKLSSETIINCLKMKERIYIYLKDSNKIANVNEWWFNQVLFIVSYFITNFMIKKEDFNIINKWVLEHLNYKNYIYIKKAKKLYSIQSKKWQEINYEK